MYAFRVTHGKIHSGQYRGGWPLTEVRLYRSTLLFPPRLSISPKLDDKEYTYTINTGKNGQSGLMIDD